MAEEAFDNLYKACCKGDRTTAAAILDQKDIDLEQVLNTKNPQDGTTVLHMAADEGLADLVQQLLDKGCDIQAVDNEGLNVLHWALRGGKNPDLVWQLLAREDCFSFYDESANEEGFTPLLCGLKNGSTEAVKVLIQLDGKMASWCTDTTDIQLKFKIDFKRIVSAGQNIYVLAMAIKDPELIQLLIEKDNLWQDHIIIRQEGRSGLQVAADLKLWKNIEAVIVNRDLTVSPPDLEEVLLEVVKDGQEKLLYNILEKQSKKGTLNLSTKLIHATLASPKRSQKTVEILVQHEADITGLNEYGLNIAHVIASNGYEKILSVITVNLPKKSFNNKFQALLTQKCKDYKTQLCIGETVHPFELHQCTALHIAALNMHFPVLSKLLVYGANPNDKDDNDRSPFQLVKELCDEFGSLDPNCSSKLDEIYEALLKANRELSVTNVQKSFFQSLEKTVIGGFQDVKTDVVSMKEDLGRINATTDQSHDIIRQVNETVISLEHNLEASSEKTITLLQDVKEEISILKCSVSVNEMVQYEVLNIIAKEIGQMRRTGAMPFWELLADELLKAVGCPTEISSSIKQKVVRENNSDRDCALQFLICWKSLICQGNIHWKALAAALKNIQVEIPELRDLPQQLAQYWQTQTSVDLSDKELGNIARRLGKEWVELGIQLDLEKADLDKIDADHSRTQDKIMEMLCTWRMREAGYTDVKVVRLCKALTDIGRVDIAQDINSPLRKSTLCNLV